MAHLQDCDLFIPADLTQGRLVGISRQVQKAQLNKAERWENSHFRTRFKGIDKKEDFVLLFVPHNLKWCVFVTICVYVFV